MPVRANRQLLVRSLGRAALAGVAAACAGSGAPAPRSAPAPAVARCPLVTDSGAPPADTIRFVADGRAGGSSSTSLTECADTMPGTSPVVDTIALPRGGDLRDFLDRGLPATAGPPRADVLVTRDPDVLSYAAQLGTYRGIALPWDRTYALVAPRFDSTAVQPTADERAALARDAVQADARGAQPPFWWETDTTCATGTPRYSPGAPRIIGYPADDPIARQLAERMVALAGAPQTPSWIPSALSSPAAGPLRTVGFAPTALNDALASGQIAAFVTGVPRSRPAECSGPARIPAGALLVPLVDSRAHALMRRGSGASFVIGPDGVLRFVPHPTP